MSANILSFANYVSTIYAGNAAGTYKSPTVPITNPTSYVPFAEIETTPSEGPNENFGDNAHAKRVLRCRWQDRMTLIWQLLGGPIILGSLGNPSGAQATAKWASIWYKNGTLAPSYTAVTGDVLVLSPHMYPYNEALFAVRATVVPEGNPAKGGPLDQRISQEPYPAPGDEISNWGYARITVEYEAPPVFGVNTTGYTQFFKEALAPSTEFLTLPRNNLYWDSGLTVPINVNEAPGFEIKKFIYTVTRRKVTATGTLLGLIGTMQGCVNSGSFGGTYITAGTGLVLFEGATFEPDSLNDGTPAVKCEMKFRLQTAAWNKFPHVQGTSGGGTQLSFDSIYQNTGGGAAAFLPYPTANLQQLISASFW